MKELSIEEKARRYDEAIERAKEINREHSKKGFKPSDNVLYIFPELAESEDENIKKALIIYHSSTGSTHVLDKFTSKQICDWLEKHGEQKTVDEIAKEVCKNKASAMTFLKSAGIINENGELAEQYRQSEQKTTDKVEPKFKVGQTIKKEGFNLGFTIVKIENGFYYNDVGDNFPFTDQDNWEFVEQNPVWNEEDETKRNALICLVKEIKNQPLKKLEDWDGYISWLKSLKPQNTWKPSNEQMEGIECTIKTLRYQLNAGDNRLDSLYNDLKKLRNK